MSFNLLFLNCQVARKFYLTCFLSNGLNPSLQLLLFIQPVFEYSSNWFSVMRSSFSLLTESEQDHNPLSQVDHQYCNGRQNK